jgi:hypothetical protein
MGLTLSVNKINKEATQESKGACIITTFIIEAMLFGLLVTAFEKGNGDEKIAALISSILYILLLLYVHTKSNNTNEYSNTSIESDKLSTIV